MLAVAATVLSGFTLAAFAAPAAFIARDSSDALPCGAIPFVSNHTYADYFRVTAYPTQFTAGQTITATVVDLSTCAPFANLTGSNNLDLIKVSGTALDANFKWDSAAVPASGSSANNSTIVFAASVPNGSTDLDLAVIANFSPASGGPGRLEYVIGGLGVVYTAA